MMKRSCFSAGLGTMPLSFLLLLALTGCGGTSAVKPQSSAPSGDYGALERAVFKETNVLRSDPRGYSSVLKAMMKRFDGKVYQPEGSEVGVVTHEGKPAVEEAIAVLRKTPSLSSLRWSEPLAEVARAHVTDTGAKGLLGHGSSDGSDFAERVGAVAERERFRSTAENIAYGPESGREVVAQLVVDDGVASRGHRKNLLLKKLKYVGVGCGYHSRFRMMCVAIYADGP